MTKNTRVCSNHFVHGAPTKDHPSPVLYLKGYPVEIYEMQNIVPPSNARTGMKRSEAMERKYTRPEKKGRYKLVPPVQHLSMTMNLSIIRRKQQEQIIPCNVMKQNTERS